MPNLRSLAQFTIAILLVYGAYVLLQPFMLPIITAVIFALIVRPLYRSIRKHVTSDTVAALLCILVVILIVLIPAGLMSIALIREAESIAGTIRYGSFDIDRINEFINHLISQLHLGTVISVDVRSYTLKIVNGIAGHSAAVLGGVFGVIGDAIIALFGLFYLLQGSDKMRPYVRSLSPLQHSDTDLLMDRAQQVVQATVRGNVILVLLQGSCFILGCLVFGFKAPLILGILYGLTSMIPVVGTSVIWGPMLIISLLTGHTGSGIGIAVWAITQVVAIDHILGPKIIGARTKLNPFLALLGILGGISQFGLLGFIIGPTIIALAVVGLELLGRSWLRD